MPDDIATKPKRQAALAPGDYALAADYAYAMLRRGIEEGDFTPGARMREIELATWLGVSRTPVRQALSRLEVEGILTLAPRSGLVVASLDAEAVAELYDMREALESAAANLAARNASPREIAELKQLLAENPPTGADPVEFAKHNKRLHRAIYEAAHNRFLVKSMQALHDALLLLGPTTLSTLSRRREAHEEHSAIVDAIARRDGEAAMEIATTHIRHARDVRVEQMNRAARKTAAG